MAFPLVLVFAVLLLLYMVYSYWYRLDPRLLVGAALVLLVATALTEALGAGGAAATLAEYVFLLLGGGVVLLLAEHLRPTRSSAPPAGALGEGGFPAAKDEAPDPPNQR
jgi:hypothetical protein